MNDYVQIKVSVGGKWKHLNSNGDGIRLKSKNLWKGFFCAAHPFVFRLVWLLRCPTLRALVRFVSRATGLRRSCLVCVALRAGLVRLGGSTVHLQTPQVAALEAALFHDATRPPCVGAIACRLTWKHSKGGLVNLYICAATGAKHTVIQHNPSAVGNLNLHGVPAQKVPGICWKVPLGHLERTWTCPPFVCSRKANPTGHTLADICSLIVYLAQPGVCLAQQYRSTCQIDKMSNVPTVPGAKVALQKNWIYLACKSKLILDGCLKTIKSTRSETRQPLWRTMWDTSTAGRASEHVREKLKQDDKKLTCIRTKTQRGGTEDGSTWLAQSSQISMEMQTIQETSVPSREVAQIKRVWWFCSNGGLCDISKHPPPQKPTLFWWPSGSPFTIPCTPCAI